MFYSSQWDNPRAGWTATWHNQGHLDSRIIWSIFVLLICNAQPSSPSSHFGIEHREPGLRTQFGNDRSSSLASPAGQSNRRLKVKVRSVVRFCAASRTLTGSGLRTEFFCKDLWVE